MKSVVLQQKEERGALLGKVYLKRILIDDAEQYLSSNLIKLITGPRRAGKSVFALQLLSSKDFAYLNFDDELLLSSFDEDAIMQALLEVYPQFQYLLLDEIQNVPHWEMWVAKLYRRGINLVITGSNARLLSSEMATMLTGRYVQIEVLPFGLKEVLAFRQVGQSAETPVQKANLMLQMEDYIVYGGFPETLALRSITRNYLSALFDSVLLKDITRRFKIRNSNELYNLATYLLSNYGNPFSLSQLVDDLSLGSKATAQKFCSYLEETYVFFYLPRFNNKFKLMRKAPLKPYIVDNGFIAARAFELSPNKGRLLENTVMVELIRRGYKQGQSLFYYRSRNNKEVDFVCRKGTQVEHLIQVSYDVKTPKTLKREISALLECAGELHCDNLLLLTWDEDKTVEQDHQSIKLIPVWKWMTDWKITGQIPSPTLV